MITSLSFFVGAFLWGLPAGWAGTLDGEVALDALHATSTSDQPSSGPQPQLSATELGVRVRGTLEQGRWLAAIDYLGREPVAGLFPNSAFRTFYRLEGVYRSEGERLELGVGRFVAPSVVLLAVDGARLAVRGEALRFEVFGGRRGLSTSLRGVSPATILPAGGASLSYLAERGRLELLGALAGDEVPHGIDSDGEVPGDVLLKQSVLGWNGAVRGHVRLDPVLVGASVTGASQASYRLAAAGADPTLDVRAIDLFQALAYVSWRPSDRVRLDADVLRQSATVVAGPVDLDPPGARPLVDPSFVDLRARGALRPALGWIRPDVRLRLRSEADALDGGARTELRYGSSVELDDLGIEGPVLRAQLFVDDILLAGPAADNLGAVDRLLWSASGGWSRGPLDLEAGASFTDRALAPVSSRGLVATRSDDLSPFVLEAQNVVFGRGFLAQRRWFVGTDVEVSVDAPEIRAFLQVGMLAEADF